MRERHWRRIFATNPHARAIFDPKRAGSITFIFVRPIGHWGWRAAAVGVVMGCGGSSSTKLPQEETNTAGPDDASAASANGGGSHSGSSTTGVSPASTGVTEAGADSTSGGSSTSADSAAASPSDGASDSANDAGATTDGETATACAGGTTYDASNAGAPAEVNSFGFVRLVTSNDNQIVGFDTTLTVPTEPPPMGTLFLWPGLQPNPGGANFATLNNGVLQPVLTWGPTCAPNSPGTDPFASWWISAQYVNTFITDASANFAAYTGCHGGPGMDVAVGDNLDITMALSGMNWVQTVTDARSGTSVSYTIDMLGQAQNLAEFVIEPHGQEPVSDVIFTSTTITFASSQPSACQPQVRGTNDYFSAPQASSDGLHCCIAKVILRAEGVAATSPDTP
ncbi:MAG TPA: hypothetical protein VEK07_11570 [Polyangiaceae bacterium]|nr:hypothetical protein [Polyangiaceae bacterium]